MKKKKEIELDVDFIGGQEPLNAKEKKTIRDYIKKLSSRKIVRKTKNRKIVK